MYGLSFGENLVAAVDISNKARGVPKLGKVRRNIFGLLSTINRL
jgi:hypothetical protein